MRPITWSTAVPLAVIIASSGAGGGESRALAQTSTNNPPRDRAGYIIHADALCRTANVSQETLARRAKGIPATKLGPILREQAKIAGQLAANLAKLSPPAGDRLTVRGFVRSVHQLSVYSSALGKAIDAGHTSAARTLAVKLTTARQREKHLAQHYGYKTCGSGNGY